MASSRGEISGETSDNSPGGDPHMPRDAPLCLKEWSLTRDRSSFRPRQVTSRTRTTETSARRSTDRWTQHRFSAAARRRDDSLNYASNRLMDWSQDRPARDRSAVGSRETYRDRYSNRSAYRPGDDSARDHSSAGCRDDWSNSRSDRLPRRSERSYRNNFSGRASEILSERNDDKGGSQKGGREPEPGTGRGAGSASGRRATESGRKRYHGGEWRDCGGGGERAPWEKTEERCNRARSESGSGGSSRGVGYPGEGDQGHAGWVSGLRKQAVGGGRRPGKDDDKFEKGGEVNGLWLRSGSLFSSSVRTTMETPGILEDTSRSVTSSDRSKLGHGSEGDVEEQQLPSHLLGKKPEFKTSGSGVAKGLVFTLNREEDPRRLAQRQKQIDFGKNTVGYDEYIRKVPIHARRKGDPVTPDKGEKMSKRKWAGRISSWRRQLHAHDKKASSKETPSTPSDSDEFKESGEVTPSPALRSSSCSRDSNGVAKVDYCSTNVEGDKGGHARESVAPMPPDHCQQQELKEKREQPNAGIYNTEAVVGDVFGEKDGGMAGSGGCDYGMKRKRRESSAISYPWAPLEGVFSEEEKEDDDEDNNDDSEGYGRQRRSAKRRCRRRAWKGWGMPTNPLKLNQGEQLEHGEQSPPKGHDVEEGRGTAESIDMAANSDDHASREDEVQPRGFRSPRYVTDGRTETVALGEKASCGSFSNPMERRLDGAGVGAGQQRRLGGIENDSLVVGDPLHSGQAATFSGGGLAAFGVKCGKTVATSTEKAPTTSEIDWDGVDFSDDDLL